MSEGTGREAADGVRGADAPDLPDSPAVRAPTDGERTAPGGELRGLRALTADEFSFADAVGGVRGLVESTLPGLVFVVVFLVADRSLGPALVAAAAVAVGAVVVRLVQRTPVTQAFAGVLGVGVGVAWAWWTGRAGNYFVGGFLLNAAWLVGILLSLAVRRPVVGVVVSLLRGEDMSWRTDPGQDHLRRRYVWASWLWAVMFAARLGVQVPLWAAGDDQLGWLGTARLAMGVPLFAATLWVTWLLVGSRGARADRPGPPPTPPR